MKTPIVVCGGRVRRRIRRGKEEEGLERRENRAGVADREVSERKTGKGEAEREGLLGSRSEERERRDKRAHIRCHFVNVAFNCIMRPRFDPRTQLQAGGHLPCVIDTIFLNLCSGNVCC